MSHQEKLREKAMELFGLITDCSNVDTSHYYKYHKNGVNGLSEIEHIEQALIETRNEALEECVDLRNRKNDYRQHSVDMQGAFTTSERKLREVENKYQAMRLLIMKLPRKERG